MTYRPGSAAADVTIAGTACAALDVEDGAGCHTLERGPSRPGKVARMDDHRAGFATFVRDNTRSLFGTALVLSGNPDAAEELVQDTLARLYPKWHTVAAAQSPVAYVRRALINQFISAGRGPRGRQSTLFESPPRTDGTDVAEVVAGRQTLVLLLRTLPPRQRAALVMRYLYDQPDTEVAAALGCRVATVRSLVSRGIATMHSRYTDASTGTGAGAGAAGGQR
jgi:RNA polymerase sigma-70 factor (sigma-E family)